MAAFTLIYSLVSSVGNFYLLPKLQIGHVRHGATAALKAKMRMAAKSADSEFDLHQISHLRRMTGPVILRCRDDKCFKSPLRAYI